MVLTALGHSTQLTAEVRDQAGRAMDGVSVAWSSADTTVAVVDSTGLVTAVGSGAVTVTATAGEAAGDALVTVTDRAALVALYNATDGPNWVDNTNWLTDAPLGEWYGVSTDARGRVVGINLAGRWDNEAREIVRHGLMGELPADVANLTQLEFLFLRHNDLTGAIPPELGGLASLNILNLGSNSLTGPIPPELGGLASLQVLNLGSNSLSGPIPPELGGLASLEWLYISARIASDGFDSARTRRLGELGVAQSRLEWSDRFDSARTRRLGELGVPQPFLHPLLRFDSARTRRLGELGEASSPLQ